MPALVLCGRRWEVGSDDLVFPGVISVTLRSLVLLALVIALVAYKDNLSCPDIADLIYLSYVLIILTLVVITLEIAITAFSARGTIINSRPRRPVPYLLYVRTGLFGLETITVFIAIVFAFKDRITSDKSVLACSNLSGTVTAIQVFVVLSILLLLVIVIGTIIYLDPCYCYRMRTQFSAQQSDRLIFEQQMTLDGPELWQRRKQENRSLWKKRFRVAFCSVNLGSDHQAAYSELAAVFSSVLCDVNAVPSDIAAGLVLLQRHQLSEEVERQRMQEGGLGEDTPPPIRSRFSDATDYFRHPLDFSNDEEVSLFSSSMYYFKYAVASYAWRGEFYMGESCAACRLCAQMIRGGCCWQDRRDFVVADNKCHCSFYGLRNLSRLVDAEIVYCSFENNLYQVPFYVVVDHEKKAVVVTTRGTFSLYDVATDLISYTEPIVISGSENCQHYAHKGIFRSAVWVKEALCGDGNGESILDRAFRMGRGYKLILTGHSLGGGCSALLSVLLKEHYPDLQCFVYGVPGALLDINGAMHTKSFITSVTLGKDLVARLSIYTCYMLKQDLLSLLQTYNKPKYRILLEGALETLSSCCGRRHIFNTMQVNVKLETPSTASSEFAQLEQQEREVEDEQDGPHATQLGCHPPASTPTFPHAQNAIDVEVPQLEQVQILISDNTEDSNETHLGREGSFSPTSNQNRDDLSLQGLLRVPSDSRQASPNLANTPSSPAFRIPLYPPGRIIHIREIPSRRSTFADKQYEANWVSNESFQRIIVCPDMLRDHFPHSIKNAMESVWNSNQSALQRTNPISPSACLC